MLVNLGQGDVTVKRKGEDVTHIFLPRDFIDYYSRDQAILPLPYKPETKDNSYAYPFGLIMERCKELDQSTLMDRQTEISISPRFTIANPAHAKRARFYTTLIRDEFFLVSEDPNFLTLPLGRGLSSSKFYMSPVEEHFAVAASLNSLVRHQPPEKELNADEFWMTTGIDTRKSYEGHREFYKLDGIITKLATGVAVSGMERIKERYAVKRKPLFPWES